MSIQMQSIPRFSLYGEDKDQTDSEFIHIESIATRSEYSAWVIKPHRHGKLLQIVFIEQGHAEIELDNQQISVERPSAIIVPPNAVHGFQFTPSTRGYVLTIAEPIVNQATQSRASDYLQTLTLKPQVVTFAQDSSFLPTLSRLLDEMMEEFEHYWEGRHHMIEWVTKMILMTLYREIDQQQLLDDKSNEHSKFNEFCQSIEVHFRQHWSVEQYADSLGVSVSTLNRLCKQHRDTSAKKFIHERMFTEAKRRLLYTQANVDQIAFQLGFEDPAYFSRFFKRKADISPKQYRQTNPFNTEYRTQ
ncbi:helix-turn-helix domain-containing protein [Vibrio maerlii]|uniref:helix-turn-helix domain-containing protein n=1 Tax=Vibrio maerlii TaxID=2231648 RepID=UPI001F14960A|nr:helix-turn-helix domain-containing protein [Vibrio maerlii]